jgi:transcriptional regulator with XRE-family HTH domain
VKEYPSTESNVGRRLRELRTGRGLSIRTLAEQSGLNVNTLSLIENNKTSPSVSTLQQLANALQVSITAFFEDNFPKNYFSYQRTNQRVKASFAHGTFEDLGGGIDLEGGQALLVTLEPGASSGVAAIVHIGLELVYCLDGHLSYTVEGREYPLEPGDSLLFEAHLPHSWKNTGDLASRSLLIVFPTAEDAYPSVHHFKTE